MQCRSTSSAGDAPELVTPPRAPPQPPKDNGAHVTRTYRSFAEYRSGDRHDVGFYDNMGRFVVEPGQIDVYVGDSSNATLTKSFTVTQ